MEVLRVLARDVNRNLQCKVRIPAGFPGRCLLLAYKVAKKANLVLKNK